MDTDLQTTDTATINRGVARERGLLEPCPPPPNPPPSKILRE